MEPNNASSPPTNGGLTTNQAGKRERSINWLHRYRYRNKEKHGEDDPHNDMRNVLLVVSALIAAVTFQAGVSPPGGVWQDSNGHTAGSAIYSTHKVPFYTFLIFNTLALSSSVFVIISLTFMFPFSVEIWIATISMLVTYGSSVFGIIPHHGDYKFRYFLLTAALPVVVRVVVEVSRYLKQRKYFDKCFSAFIRSPPKSG